MAKVTKFLVLTGVIVEILYILSANVFLNGPFLRGLINRAPQDVRIDYRWGLSLWPGLVWLRGVNLRVQGESVQFYFELDSARVQVALTRLVQREFCAREIDGDGLDFRVRFRKPVNGIDPTMLNAVAPIPGFASLKLPIKPDLPSPNPFKVRLQNVVVKNLRQLWLQEYRFNGSAVVRGNFFLHPGGRQIELSGARLQVASGQISWNGNPVFESVHSDIAVQIRAVAPNEAPGVKLLEFVDASMEFDSNFNDPSFLNYYLRGSRWMHISEIAGALRINAKMHGGVFEDDGHLELEAKKIAIGLFRQQVRGRGLVDWTVKKREGQFRLKLLDYEMRPHDSESNGIYGHNLAAVIRTKELHLTKPVSAGTLDLDLPAAKIVNLGFANSFLPRGSGIKFGGGSGEVSAKLAISTDPKVADHGRVVVKAIGAKVELEKNNVSGNLDLNVRLNSGKLNQGTLDIAGTTLSLNRVIQSGTEANWWADLNLVRGSLALGNQRAIIGTLEISGRDAMPIVDIYLRASDSGMPGILKSVLAFKDLLVHVDVAANDKGVRFSNLEAAGKNTLLQGWLTKSGNQSKGAFLLKYGPLAAGLELKNEKVSVRLQDAIGWFHDNDEHPVK